MNCKPGDLAVIVRVPAFAGHLLGRVLRVITAVKSAGGNPAWSYEGPRLRSVNTGEAAECVEDQFLRPIRDPGDDARDESLDWLPVPADKVPA